jgi:hypothetical protein
LVPEKHIAVAGIFNLQNITGATRVALAKAIADVVLEEKVSGAPAAHRTR